jgi:hypothetical protein
MDVPVMNPISAGKQFPIRIQSDSAIFDFHLYSAYDIVFHTYPLLIGREGEMDQFRLAVADIDYVQLIVDGIVISTVPNYHREEPIMHRSQINGVYSVPVDFLYKNGNRPRPQTGVMRVVFWREPLAPFWITYDRVPYWA